MLFFSLSPLPPSRAFFPIFKNGEFPATMDVSRMPRLIVQQMMLVNLVSLKGSDSADRLISAAEERKIVL